MTTMELEAQKGELARLILNIDDMEVIKEMSKAYRRIEARMQKEASCRYTVSEMEERLKQSRQDVKSGRYYTQDEMKKRYEE
ncbi:hypothetical protein [Bacteroides cellulosilyticus]|uniref:hypothetical protein n=1 Tax=Bacteroides cellulosilyticus TaxID=246787 RepID=UPI0032BF92DA